MARLRLLLGAVLFLVSTAWMLLCIAAPSALATVAAIVGMDASALTMLMLMYPLIVLGAVILLERAIREATAKRRRVKTARKTAAQKRKNRKLEIRDAITTKLSLFGSVVELYQLPYPIEESERVVQTMLKEDAALRYDEFESITSGSINKVKAVWIARHLKV